MTFLVTWTGGLEPPDFFGTNDRDEALERFANWSNTIDPDSGEVVHCLLVNEDGSIEILEIFWGQDEEEKRG